MSRERGELRTSPHLSQSSPRSELATLSPGTRIYMLRSAIRATLARMSRAPSPLSLRLGQDGQDALQEIARRRSISRAEAARQAIRETAARDRLRNGLAAEARRLMADSAYVREARDVAAMMEELRGPW